MGSRFNSRQPESEDHRYAKLDKMTEFLRFSLSVYVCTCVCVYVCMCVCVYLLANTATDVVQVASHSCSYGMNVSSHKTQSKGCLEHQCPLMDEP